MVAEDFAVEVAGCARNRRHDVVRRRGALGRKRSQSDSGVGSRHNGGRLEGAPSFAIIAMAGEMGCSGDGLVEVDGGEGGLR